jgi:hypothetical protein
MTSAVSAATLEASSTLVARAPSTLHRVLVFPLKLFWGMLFCQGLAGSILVVGWTYRLAQRSAFKAWFWRSARPHTRSALTEFLASHPSTRAHAHWPNWFARQNFTQATTLQAGLSPGRQSLNLLVALLHSLWLNFWIGLRGIVNTAALTLPACIFWWFGWYDGWNNSFNKGYEQAAVGPLISFFGIAWFITAMFYVPLAQARQAVTGDWRSFYQFRLIRKLVRDRWVYCVMLAILYTLLSVPLNVMKTSPMFWMHSSPALSALTGPQVKTALNSYFFWCALYLLPAFVLLHLGAARIYASGLVSLLQAGQISESDLAPTERQVLERLALLEVRPQPRRHALVRFVAWSGTRLGRVVGAVILVLIWFSFIAQIYITQFLNYHPGLGWLNQPLIQLPWFRYLPASVSNPLGQVLSALLVLLLALLIRWVRHGVQEHKAGPAVIGHTR